MAKQNRAAEDKKDVKRRRKAKPVTAEPVDGQATVAELAGEPIGAVDSGSIEVQATRLSDRRLQSAQRRTLAARVGQVQGNQHLQKVVASLEWGEKARQFAAGTADRKRPLVHKLTHIVQQTTEVQRGREERDESLLADRMNRLIVVHSGFQVPSIQQKSMMGWAWSDEKGFIINKKRLEKEGYTFINYAKVKGSWKKTEKWSKEFWGIDWNQISASDVAWDIVGPKPKRGKRSILRKVTADKVVGVCEKLLMKLLETRGEKPKSWTEYFFERVDEMSGEYPWVPGIVWRELRRLASKGVIHQPFWIMRLPSGYPYRKHVVVRWRSLYAGITLEIYLEFAASEEYYRKVRHIKGRSAIHAAESAKSWNTKMWDCLNNPNELRSVENVRNDLMEAQWQYLMKSFLVAVMGVASAAYPTYGAGEVAEGLGLGPVLKKLFEE